MKKQWIINLIAVQALGWGFIENSLAEDAKNPPKLEINRPTTPTPKTDPGEFKLKDPDELYTRIFKTPPAGYAPSYKQKHNTRTPKQILEEFGVNFPKGSSAKYDWETGFLTITNNEAGMAYVETYLDYIANHAEKNLQFQVEIYRLPSLLVLELQDSAGKHSDNTPERDAVLKLVKQGHAILITSVDLVCGSGQHGKFEDGIEYRYVDRYEWQESSKKILPVFKTQPTGTIFEVDPVLGADNSTIDVSFHFEHHTAPPEQEMAQIRLPDSENNIDFPLPVFHAKKITTQTTMHSGSTKIIGVYRPTGKPEYQKEDVMEIVFLKGIVVTTKKPIFSIEHP